MCLNLQGFYSICHQINKINWVYVHPSFISDIHSSPYQCLILPWPAWLLLLALLASPIYTSFIFHINYSLLLAFILSFGFIRFLKKSTFDLFAGTVLSLLVFASPMYVYYHTMPCNKMNYIDINVYSSLQYFESKYY